MTTEDQATDLTPMERLRGFLGPSAIMPKSLDGQSFDVFSFSPASMGRRSLVLARLPKDGAGLTPEQLGRFRDRIAATINTSDEAPLDGVQHVKDPAWGRTLSRLAAARRSAFSGVCISVTGSAGKTSASSMLVSALTRLHGPGAVRSTCGNENLFVGVAHTLSGIGPDHSHVVQEIAVGHAPRTAAMLKPHVALITNISEAHVEAFASMEDIAVQKAATLRELCPDGAAVICRDTACFDALHASVRPDVNLVTYGFHPDATWRILSYDPASGEAQLALPGGCVTACELTPMAPHLALNMVGAITVLAAAGEKPEAAIQAARAWTPVAGRGQSFPLACPAGGEVVVVDDAYNAAPIAMHAAIRALGLHREARRRILVLGEMRELGARSDALHQDLAAVVADQPIDAVYAVGPAYEAFWERLPERQKGGHLADMASLAATLRLAMRDGDIWWFKGAHGSGLYRGVNQLRAARQEAK